MTETVNLQQASTETDKELRAIAESLSKENLSRLTLPEVDAEAGRCEIAAGPCEVRVP